jgi:nucleoside-diphosphate-sugar epimerase
VNILITGAGGFIGQHLFSHLKLKHSITRIFSQNQPAEKKNSYSVNLAKNNEVAVLIQELSRIKYGCVIHLASEVASPGQTKDVRLLHSNIAITENLVNITKNLRPNVLINLSSMAIYPHVSGSFSEKSMPGPEKNPDCLYGLSKYCAEVMIDFLLEREKIRVLHLRVSQVQGEGMRHDRIIPSMLRELMESNKITVYGSGKRISNFVSVDRLSEEVEFFIENDIAGTFNVGGENISYINLARNQIAQYGNQDSTIDVNPQGNKEEFRLDISKLNSLHESD